MLRTSSRPASGRHQHRAFVVAGVLVAAPLLLAGCGSSSSGGSSAATQPPAASATTPPAATGGDTSSSAGATFDGDFKGVLTLNLCTNGNAQGSVKATVDGDSATNYLGSVSATELSFLGPKGGIYSTKPGTKITISGGTWNVDGLVLTDDVITHNSVTVHGTLTCP
jgi:hypothetical protein